MPRGITPVASLEGLDQTTLYRPTRAAASELASPPFMHAAPAAKTNRPNQTVARKGSSPLGKKQNGNFIGELVVRVSLRALTVVASPRRYQRAFSSGRRAGTLDDHASPVADFRRFARMNSLQIIAFSGPKACYLIARAGASPSSEGPGLSPVGLSPSPIWALRMII